MSDSAVSNPDYGFGQRDPASRVKVGLLVIVVHVLLIYALVFLMPSKNLAWIKKPLEAMLIQEVMIAPLPSPLPMPQPKKIKPPVSKPVVAPRPEVLAPDSTVVTTDTVANLSAPATPPAAAPELSTSPVPAVIAPLPQMATAVAKPNRSEISVVCPSQTAPVMPRTALEQGIQGVVRAQALIKDGLVKEVTILSGPRIFHNAVRTAMLQYRCTRDAAEVVAVQVFNFKIEDPAESGDELQ